jgi:hypothetical protein
MRPALLILNHYFVLEDNGVVTSPVNGEVYWVGDAERTYLEAIEFFTLALKTYKEDQAKREAEKARAR